MHRKYPKEKKPRSYTVKERQHLDARARRGKCFKAGVLVGFVCAVSVLCAPRRITAATAQWDKLVTAAQKEGKVVVAAGGAMGNKTRRLVTEGFQKQFPGIQVEMTVGGGRDLAPRMLMERRAGRYLWDVYMGGTTTALSYLVPAGILDPIQPVLVLPEITDKSRWLGGNFDFADDAAKYSLAFVGYVKPPFAFNSNLVKAKDFISYWDLLDPKWKGRIALQDARRPGAGLGWVTFCYVQPALGKEFLGRFFSTQDIKLVADYRQLTEWVSKGDVAIGIGHSPDFYDEFKNKGLPLGEVTADDLKEGSYITAAAGSVSLVNRAPHPNAASVFINWLLTKDTQAAWSESSGYPSRRLDVPHGHLNPGVVPKQQKLSLYIANYKENLTNRRDEIRAFLGTVLKK